MKKQLVISLLALVLVPALVLAQKTSYDFDKSANFAAFKTYAHKDGTKVGQQLIDDRIVAAIDSALATKGLTRSDKPDVFVVIRLPARRVDATRSSNRFLRVASSTMTSIIQSASFRRAMSS